MSMTQLQIAQLPIAEQAAAFRANGFEVPTYLNDTAATAVSAFTNPISSNGLGNYATIIDTNGVATGVDQGAYDALYGTQDTGYSMVKNDINGGLGTSGVPTESNSKAFGNYAAGVGAIGGLGLGVLSYMDNSKTADAQRKLLGQQYASNATTMKNSAADRIAAMKAFGVA